MSTVFLVLSLPTRPRMAGGRGRSSPSIMCRPKSTNLVSTPTCLNWELSHSAIAKTSFRWVPSPLILCKFKIAQKLGFLGGMRKENLRRNCDCLCQSLDEGICVRIDVAEKFCWCWHRLRWCRNSLIWGPIAITRIAYVIDWLFLPTYQTRRAVG